MAGKGGPRSPAQQAALRKAQLISAEKRRGRKTLRTRRIYGHKAETRGQGVSGLKQNFVPYARVNQRSQTGGFNVGTILPGTGKRIVFGGYLRLENRKRGGVVSSGIAKAGRTLAPKGTKRGAVKKYFNENVTVKAPGIRANVGGGQVRLGTSRGSGATLIVRRGRHKTPITKSRSGLRKYDKRVKAIAGVKATRSQRRKV